MSIHNKLQQIKDVADPLEKEITHQYNVDKYRGNFLAKASAKMIQTYNEKITELLVDDLLYETAGLLTKME